MRAFEGLNYDGWPEPWWTIAFEVTEDFWDAIMDMNYALGRDMLDLT